MQNEVFFVIPTYRLRDVGATVEHLVGMQAQVPQNPYTALWSRLDDFKQKHGIY